MNKPITVRTLYSMKQRGEKFAVLTAYDASFARVLSESGVEVLLVGDSLGMVVQGQESTLPVTVDDMVYHTRMVRRGSGDALVIADMPFMSYNSPEQALATAHRLMGEGHAHMVKLEGGQVAVAAVRRLAEQGVPVCAHIGLLPQSVYKLGGYRVQGKEAEAAQTLMDDAQALVQAGADLLLMECVPAALAEGISRAVPVPTIGIGAGPGCDGQVLVLYDILGLSAGHRPRFSKDFLLGQESIAGAAKAFVQAVKSGSYPAPEHCF